MQAHDPGEIIRPLQGGRELVVSLAFEGGKVPKVGRRAGIEEIVQTRSSMTEDSEQTLQSIVVLPETGIDCNDSLSFHLSEAVNSAMSLVVYNNQQISVLKKEIPPNELLYELDFKLDPGRYYWKLDPTDRNLRRQLGVAVGVFLVKASLMPDD